VGSRRINQMQVERHNSCHNHALPVVTGQAVTQWKPDSGQLLPLQEELRLISRWGVKFTISPQPMTKQISSKETISGISIVQILPLLPARRVGTRTRSGWPEPHK